MAIEKDNGRDFDFFLEPEGLWGIQKKEAGLCRPASVGSDVVGWY
jgi:hypothetical protein